MLMRRSWLAALGTSVAALTFPPPPGLLCDVPTPAVVVDMTALRRRGVALPQLLAGPPDAALEAALADAVFVHASVQALDPADARPSPQHLARIDAAPAAVDAGCYLGLGLNNHHTGSYFWAACSGPGAAMPAPGVGIDTSDGVWLVREANSNDGKRSEWAEFLRRGDQVQLVPKSACGAIAGATVLIGVRRDGDGGIPAGAEPRVEALWSREAGGRWAEVLKG